MAESAHQACSGKTPHEVKQCTRCKNYLPRSSFHKDRQKKDGVRSDCIACCRKARDEFIEKNPGHIEAIRKQYIKRWNKENKQRLIEYSRKWAEANKDKVKASRDAYIKRSPDKLKASRAAYKKRNPEKTAVDRSARRARLRNASGSISVKEIRAIAKLQKNRCAACNDKIDKARHVDHIVPLAKNGSNDKTNIQLLCPRCNMQKGAKDPLDFMRSRGFLC